MSLTRLLLPGQPIVAGRQMVPPEVARHAVVNRVVPGDLVELCDLAGLIGIARVLAWHGKACEVDVVELMVERGELPVPVVLALAVLHTHAFDWAVEKATELGVTEIVPVLTARVQGKRHDARVERWQRIADAAVSQCGRSRVPLVHPPAPLQDLLESHGALTRLVADPAAAALPEVAPDRGLLVLIGPEGGFDDGERNMIRAAGFAGLPLGGRILRAETAAVAALSVAQALAGLLVSPA